MNILAPFDMVSEVKALIEAGANELYCGVNSKWWKKRGLFSNARHMFYGNLNNFIELKKSLQISKKYGVPVFLCINDYLPEGAFQQVLRDIKMAIDLGVDGFIVADLSLIPFIKKNSEKCKIILSTLNPCFSSEGISFYKGLGVDRIILPLNQLTLSEIEEISLYGQKLSVEIEVFINNIVCKNIPANCLFNDFELFKQHYKCGLDIVMLGLKNAVKLVPNSVRNRLGKLLYSSRLHPKPCRQNFSVEVFAKTNGNLRKVKGMNSYSSEKDFAYPYCGLCSIYFLKQCKITSGKISGRGYSTKRKINDVTFARNFLNEMERKNMTEVNFAYKGREIYQKVYRQDCFKKRCQFQKTLSFRNDD
jgi:hypothetical protein